MRLFDGMVAALRAVYRPIEGRFLPSDQRMIDAMAAAERAQAAKHEMALKAIDLSHVIDNIAEKLQ